MGATRFDIRSTSDSLGGTMLPINSNDVTYMTPTMSIVSRRVSVYVEFFDKNQQPVTPTAGSVYVNGRPMGWLWIAAVNSPIKATDVSHPLAAYTVPYMEGLVTRVAVRFVGVTGAAFAAATVYREDA